MRNNGFRKIKKLLALLLCAALLSACGNAGGGTAISESADVSTTGSLISGDAEAENTDSGSADTDGSEPEGTDTEGAESLTGTSDEEEDGNSYSIISGDTGAYGAELNEDTSSSDLDGEEKVSRALAKKSQVHDASKSALIPVNPDQEAAPERAFTVMVYMIGSNLESSDGSATEDLKEMSAAGLDYSGSNLIVYAGGAQRWISGIESTKNSVLDLAESDDDRLRAYTDGNADMGAPETLTAFVNYCTTWYPAEHYALIFWDHGGGPVLGYGSDELFDGDSLLLSEMKNAMAGTIFGKGEKLDIVGFDACLMGCLECMSVWKNYARYYIASSETEPGYGWDYSFLSTLNSSQDPSEIAESIVDGYKTFYKEKQTDTFNPDLTLSCVDLSKIDAVNKALDVLAGKLSSSLDKGDYAHLQQLRAQVKSFGSIANADGRGTTEYDLVDAEDFTEKYEEDYPSESAALKEAVSAAVVKNYSNVEESCGLTLYYPFGNKDILRGANSILNNILSSKNYRSFVKALSKKWLAQQSRDWEIAEVKYGEDEYTVSLTEDQLENMTGAYYTVLKQYEDGSYIPILEQISLDPDSTGVLHVPKDPEVICVTTDSAAENSDWWGATQTSSGRKRDQFVSHSTGLLKKAVFMDIRVETDPRFVNISLASDKSSGALSVTDASYAGDEGGMVSRSSVDLEGYSCFYGVEHMAYPQRDQNGRMKAYSGWAGMDSTRYIHYYIIESTDSPSFYTGPVSSLKGEYVLQVVIEDTAGEEYGSELVSIGADDESYARGIETPSGSLAFTVSDDHAEVTGYTGQDTELEIPSEVDGKPVTAIASEALSDSASIESLILPDSVTSIGYLACGYMTSLKEVSLPESLKEIRDEAFLYCKSLEHISLPEGLLTIGASAFYECRALESVSIPRTCITIGKGAFCDCPALREFLLADGNPSYKVENGLILTADGKTVVAFPQASSNHVIVPDGVESIGYGAFFGAHDLESVELPETLKTISYMAFFDCIALKNIQFPDGLALIEDQAFGLSQHSGQYEGFYVAAKERSAVVLHIGKNVESIGRGSFDSFLARTFTVDEDNPYYSVTDGALMNKAGDQVIAPATDGTGEIVIPDGAVSFTWDFLELSDCFSKDTSDIYQPALDSFDVVLPESVTRFESAENYTDLNKVVFHCARDSAAWEYAEDNGISHDDGTADDYRVVSEDTERGTLTFYIYSDHAQLAEYSGEDETLVIPDEVEGVHVTQIGDGTPYDGILKGKEESGEDNKTVTEVQLPSGLEVINDYAFYAFDNLSEMEIPDSVTTIGSNALKYPFNLERLPSSIEYLGAYFAYSNIEGTFTLPAGVKDIDPEAFGYMRSVTGFALDGTSETYSVSDGILCSADGTELVLYPPAGPEEVEIPEGVVRIGKRAFYSARFKVSKIIFSSTITEIGERAFASVSPGGEKALEVVLNEGLQTIGKSAFQSSALREISIPDTVKLIGDSAFADCDMLQSITIPGSVETIGDRAFNQNDSLQKLEIGEGVRTIGSYAFYKDTELESVVLPDSLYSVGNHAFSADFRYVDAEENNTEDGEDAYSEQNPNSDTDIGTDADNASEVPEPFTLHIGSALAKTGYVDAGSNEFWGLNLAAFEVDEDNTFLGAVDGFLTDVSGEVLIACPSSLSGTVTVPDGITRIAEDAFAGCYEMTDVVIPDSVTIIGPNAFPRVYVRDADNPYSFNAATMVTIHCGAGSAAEKYAIANDIRCVT